MFDELSIFDRETKVKKKNTLEHLQGKLLSTKFSTHNRYEAFAREYIVDFNAQRAATAAGFSRAGIANASSILRKPLVAAYIRKLQAQRASRLKIDADRIIEELTRIGFANMQDYIGSNGQLDFKKLSSDTAAAIAEIREDATGGTGDGERRRVLRTTFKLHDKLRALELLGKYLGLFQERQKIEVEVSIADSLRQARQRLEVLKVG